MEEKDQEPLVFRRATAMPTGLPSERIREIEIPIAHVNVFHVTKRLPSRSTYPIQPAKELYGERQPVRQLAKSLSRSITPRGDRPTVGCGGHSGVLQRGREGGGFGQRAWEREGGLRQRLPREGE